MGISVESELERKFSGIVSMFRSFASMGQYSVIDRIANSLNPNSALYAFYDALRTARTVNSRSAKVKIKKAEKEIELEIVEWTDDIKDPRFRMAEEGVLAEVIDGPEELKRLKGYKIRFVRAVHIPSESEVAEFIKLLESEGIKGLLAARKVAILALSYPSGRRS